MSPFFSRGSSSNAHHHAGMCGRFAHAEPIVITAERWSATLAPSATTWCASDDIRPTQQVPVLLAGPTGLRLGTMRWGWARDFAQSGHLINVRAEEAAQKPTFAAAWERRRCLVPFSTWFEWMAVPGQKAKAKHRLEPLLSGPRAFAACWESIGEGEARSGAVVIATVAAHPSIAAIHDRMPAILTPATASAWLVGSPLPGPCESWAEPVV